MTGLDSALGYASRGHSIFPIQPRSKFPLTPHGFKDATTDAHVITTWWTQWPDANIGAPTGKAAGFIVVDVDPRHGGDDALSELEQQHGALPSTVMALTGGGGVHYFFRYPDDRDIRCSTAVVGAGLDVKGDGGYIVLPPSIHPNGTAYQWETAHHPDDVPLAPVPQWVLDKLSPVAGPAPNSGGFTSPERISDGTRNDTLYKLVRSLKAKGLSRTAIGAAVHEENRMKCDPPLPDDEVDRLLVHAWGQADRAEFAQNGRTESPCANATDAGNAIRFATQHRATIRWCPPWKSWLWYDGTRWQRDQNTQVMRLAKRTARSILDEARQTEDDERRRKLAAWAVTSESVKHLVAMIELAKSEEGIPVEPKYLDVDPWLLNVQNGTLDLRDGQLLPHDRERLITKLTPVVYDPNVVCPAWLAFLSRIFNNDEELIDFVQLAFGYSLTASVREQVLFFLHGKGANGKSTLVRILLALLGEYSLQTPSETLLISRQDGVVRNDLARFAGARVVAALESDGGRKLAAALIKQLTGNDMVTARFLFSELFQFPPTWKIWFSTNHRPVINDDGDAMWRRPKLIPFSVQIPEAEQDKELYTKLTQELSGILVWAVEGCLRWQRDGLTCPAVVTAATAEYRQDESIFTHFLEERCWVGKDEVVKFAELRTAYIEWAKESADKPLSSKAFAAALQEHGFQADKIRNTRHYRGLRLRTMDVDDPDSRSY